MEADAVSSSPPSAAITGPIKRLVSKQRVSETNSQELRPGWGNFMFFTDKHLNLRENVFKLMTK